MLLYIGKARNIKKRMFVYKDDLRYFSNDKKAFHSLLKIKDKINVNKLSASQLEYASSIINAFTHQQQYVTRFLNRVYIIGFFECPINELESEEKRQIYLYRPPTNHQTLDKNFVFNTTKDEINLIEKINLETTNRMAHNLADKDMKKVT